MSTSIIKPIPDADMEAFVAIVANAYPSMNVLATDAQQDYTERTREVCQDPTVDLFGIYRDGKLLGGMMFHDFTMNVHGTQMLVGGVGSVAVDLIHKKERLAKEMLEFFIQHYQEKGAPLTALFPFRPDFYKKMGFGYGSQMHQYRVLPAGLPRGVSKQHVRLLNEDDKDAITACYTRYFEKTHGMIAKPQFQIDGLFRNSKGRTVGYVRDGQVLGYMRFGFRKTHSESSFIDNNIIVHEFVYETQEALSELLTFLHSQFDQINRVIIHTQDEHFYFLLNDPRSDTAVIIPHIYHESNTSGVGLMYRVSDVAGIFRLLENHDFGGQTCKLKLTVRDSFYPANDGSTVIHFAGGRATVQDGDGDDFKVEVALGVSEFSSLLMGTVTFERLHLYGSAELSDPAYVNTINRLFRPERKPVSMTNF